MSAAFLARDNIRHRRDIEDAYMHAIEQAQMEIILANAYFFPGSKFRRALMDAAGRGVRVVLLCREKGLPVIVLCLQALYGSFCKPEFKSMNITTVSCTPKLP